MENHILWVSKQPSITNNLGTYLAPVTDIHLCQNKICIEIGSGNTSPEESDANDTSFEEEEMDLSKGNSLWDD